MSGSTFVCSDPHFGHANILTFKRADGVTPLRPFKTVEEMDETMIANWNSVVAPDDRVYLLGDVAFHKRVLYAVVPRLNGRIVLVKGNHDEEKLGVYSELFDDVRSYVVKKGFIMSHIPIHPDSLSRWNINIHGHLHANYVRLGIEYDEGALLPDPRYVNVSMEQINYTPKLLDDVLKENGGPW